MTRGAIGLSEGSPAALIKSQLGFQRRIVPETSLRVMNINFPIQKIALTFK